MRSRLARTRGHQKDYVISDLFALLSAAIIGPIIVAMYLLKLRREDRRVSSTFLWQRIVRDVEANAPWQKLRRNLLLLLQLLLLLLLALALARPFFAPPESPAAT